jgi:hypothetical protein
MSIRKHSATTHHHASPAGRARRHRIAAWTAAVSIALGALSGCAQGTSQDAERGKQLDAQETSVVSDLQATESARLLNPGTPASTPNTDP